MSLVFRCTGCGGSVSKDASRCPHCSSLLKGIRCTACRFVGSEGDFLGDRCPKCGNGVYIDRAPTPKPRLVTVCKGCGWKSSSQISYLVCSRCGYVDWGMIFFEGALLLGPILGDVVLLFFLEYDLAMIFALILSPFSVFALIMLFGEVVHVIKAFISASNWKQTK